MLSGHLCQLKMQKLPALFSSQQGALELMTTVTLTEQDKIFQKTVRQIISGEIMVSLLLSVSPLSLQECFVFLNPPFSPLLFLEPPTALHPPSLTQMLSSPWPFVPHEKLIIPDSCCTNILPLAICRWCVITLDRRLGTHCRGPNNLHH